MCRAPTFLGCGRRSAGVTWASDVVWSRPGRQVVSEGRPASAMELGEAVSCRLGRSRQLTASAPLQHSTARESFVTCRLWQCRRHLPALECVADDGSSALGRQATACAERCPYSGYRRECRGRSLSSAVPLQDKEHSTPNRMPLGLQCHHWHPQAHAPITWPCTMPLKSF